MNRIQFTGLLLTGASALAFPALANAQTTGNGAAAAPATSEVVVTGSRVIKNGNNSPTPITVVSVQDMQSVQPTTLGDNLNELPVFSGSRSQTSNPNPAGGNGAANELNLRNLGSNRNLILFNGQRVPPTLSDGTVDIDMIPQLLVQRVDVVTGGVSAVYGSDAISGVINFITDNNFNGLKLQGQGGISQYGDDGQQEFGVVVGTKLFGGRGHFEASYEFRNDAGILYRTDRPWDNQWDAAGIGTAQYPYELVNNARLSTTAFGGLITSGALANKYFASNGVLSAFNAGTPTGSACCNIGGDGAYYDDSMLSPLQSHQMFARFDFDATDNIHTFVDFSGNVKRESQYLGPATGLPTWTMNSANGFLPAAYQSTLAAAGQSTFKLAEFMSDLPRQEPETDADQFMVDAGVTGKVLNYNWNLYYTHGWTTQTTVYHNVVNNDNLSAALDAVVNPANGQVVCNVTLTNPGLYPGCAPLNVFGPNAASASSLAYITGDDVVVARTTQDDIEGGVSGDVFDEWAGPVTVALSGEFRNLTFASTSSISSSLLTNCAGLRYNCTAGAALWTQSGANNPSVSENVWETAAEFDIPLLKDLPFVQLLSMNGAVRYTEYSTVGDYVTWKVGGDWRVNDELTLRATESRDIRAPTLSELYSPASHGTMTSEDYLTQTVYTLPTLGGGNPNLTAEIGQTTTAGLVWRPHWVDGLSIALDGYHILISNALYSVMGSILAAQQACYTSNGTSPFCALQVRPYPVSNTTVANAATEWVNEQINIADVETYGADLEINYATSLYSRPMAIRVMVNYQPHLLFNTPGLLDLEHAGVAYSTNSLYPAPVWAAVGTLHYKLTDQLSVDLLEHWRAPLTMQDNPTTVWANAGVPSFYTTNVNLDYQVQQTPIGHLDVFLNIQNLFNAVPPPAAFYSAQTQPGQFGGWAIGDDPTGRYFTMGFHFKY